MPSAVLLVSLLAAVCGALGEPPGHITTGAVIHFGSDNLQQYPKAAYDGVQGLRYFATSGVNQIATNALPSYQQPVLVYPGSVLGPGPILIPTQVVPGVNKGGTYYGYIVPTTQQPPQPSVPTHPPYPPPPPSPPPPPTPQPSQNRHNNVDITYDSLSSQSQQGASYTTPPPSPTPQPILSSPPPMKATTYGPPKPVVLRPYLTSRHRYILGPPHHHLPKSALGGHYHHLIPFPPKHIHAGPPAGLLLKAKPHYPVMYPHHPSPPKAPPPPPPPPAQKPQGPAPQNSVSHPDITKAIFHSQPVDSYAAAQQQMDSYAAAAAYSSSQTVLPPYGHPATHPPLYNHPVLQQPYYFPLVQYPTLLGPLHRSDDNKQTNRDYDEEEEQENELEEDQDEDESAMYSMSHYQNSEQFSHKEEEMDSRGKMLSAVTSSSWMPINAPEGAVPARAYEIPAPDLSRGNNEYTSHPSRAYEAPEGPPPARAYEIPAPDLSRYTAGVVESDSSDNRGHRGANVGRVAAVPISNGDHFSIRTDGDSQRRNLYKGNSEGVVSAVVLVKQ